MPASHHAKKQKAQHHPEYSTFINEAIVPAQASELQTGVPASVTIAQAILESAWGKSHMGAAHNYFGVKAQEDKKRNVTYGSVASGYVDKKTREHVGGKDIFVTAHFRSYKSMTDSFVDHGLFLKNNRRYQSSIEAYAKNHDADEFARGLQKAGYATDPNYAELLITIMKKNNLYKYNQPLMIDKNFDSSNIKTQYA
jgi:flagellar protein FlgJ